MSLKVPTEQENSHTGTGGEKKKKKKREKKEKSLFAALLFPAAKLIGSYSCRLYAGSTPTVLTLIGVQIAGSGPRCLGKDE